MTDKHRPDELEIHGITSYLSRRIVGATVRQDFPAVTQYVQEADKQILDLFPDDKALIEQGRQEVVQWMEREGYYYDHYQIKRYAIDSIKWQAKLKDWFKNNPELLKDWGIK